MAGCIKRFYSRCIPLEEHEVLPVCSFEELTELEVKLFGALTRASRYIFLSIFIVGTLATVIANTDGGVDGSETFLNFLQAVPMLPQIFMSRKVVTKEMGRMLETIRMCKVFFMFFLVFNTVRFYTSIQTTLANCSYEPSIFKLAKDIPTQTQCSTEVKLSYTLALLIYATCTLLQIAVINKLEEVFQRRLNRKTINEFNNTV